MTSNRVTTCACVRTCCTCAWQGTVRLNNNHPPSEKGAGKNIQPPQTSLTQHYNTAKLTEFFSECYCRYTRRGSSVVEQPIRNRQVASSTLALGSKIAKISCRLNQLTMTWAEQPSSTGFQICSKQSLHRHSIEHTEMVTAFVT